MRTRILISALVLLLVANFLMIYVTPFGLVNMDGFQNSPAVHTDVSGGVITMPVSGGVTGPMSVTGGAVTGGAVTGGPVTAGPVTGHTISSFADLVKEGFSSYSLATGAGAGDEYKPMGAFDNVRLSTGNNVSSWRYTAPNEPLTGPAFKPGPDSLFMFKNNQCKPECCGASFSCDGGCVCTTPQQRDYINQRGGNRTLPDDSV